MRKIEYAALMVVSVFVLVAVLVTGESKIDCNVPEVWGTEEGVRACAVNGGE